MADEVIENADDVVVAVEGENEPQTQIVETGETKPTAKTPDPVDELRAQLKERDEQAGRERTAREAAERAAAQFRTDAERARQEAAAARTESVESQYDTVTSGIEAAKSDAQSAEAEYKHAYEAGDAAAMVAAQRKIARAEAKIVRLDEAKAELEVRKTRTTTERAADQQQQTTQADPVEAFISTRTEPTAKWLREHRDWITDPRKNAKLSAAHFDALGEGLSADTAEYFEHVETHLGLREKPKPNGRANGANGQDQQRASNGQFRKGSAPPVAPVAASGGGTSGGGTEVRLTAKEAASATDGTLTWNYDDPSGKKKFKKGDPIGLAEFAKRKLQMQRDGRYDKSFTEN